MKHKFRFLTTLLCFLFANLTTQEIAASAQFDLRVYPNPVFGTLHFEFELAEKSHLPLDLYNPLGQRITRISDQTLSRGKQRIRWEIPAGMVPTGLYYYRLQIGRQVVCQPIVIK